ncbi:hypothetical protein OAO01_01630, partial [Oligoflexia bacterium]|nr:hypothetical protein [Oligoflexia bacterium]
MTIARSETVIEEEPGYYHCVSRCVRQAFLCGWDKLTNKDYSHRKQWIKERLKFLSGIFAIETLASGIMDNHLHTALYTRPTQAQEWDDEEVARRWWNIFPKRRDKQGRPCEPS